MVGKAPDAFACELGFRFLQHPEGQQGFGLVPGSIELTLFFPRQDPVRQLQVDLPVRFLRIDADIVLRQGTESVLRCVGDGKMPEFKLQGIY